MKFSREFMNLNYIIAFDDILQATPSAILLFRGVKVSLSCILM